MWAHPSTDELDGNQTMADGDQQQYQLILQHSIQIVVAVALAAG
jgi:hypothetical protein